MNEREREREEIINMENTCRCYVHVHVHVCLLDLYGKTYLNPRIKFLHRECGFVTRPPNLVLLTELQAQHEHYIH